MKRVRKAVGALLGGATGAVVALLLNAVGVDVTAEFATAVAVILSTVGTWVAPKNEEL